MPGTTLDRRCTNAGWPTMVAPSTKKGTIMITKTCECLEDPRELWEKRICLAEISKDARGELRLLDRELEVCEERDCRTLKTDHMLKVEVVAHHPCDSAVSAPLDGVLYVRRLITAFLDGSGENRGLHTGVFMWAGASARVEGTLSGVTNVGTHRQPVFDPCQECRAPGFMEGRLCGRIVKAEDDRLVGCNVTAAYRFRFDASQGGQDTAIAGTIEGLVVCPCKKDNCLDLTGFPAMAHPNPWRDDRYTFQVFDHTGTLTATADVVTWGAFTGLNASFRTQIFVSPSASVDITLVHFAAPATVTALDGDGTTLDTATMSVAAGAPETLHLSGVTIESLELKAPSNETLILEVCAQP